MKPAPRAGATYIEKAALDGLERGYRERHERLPGAGSFQRLLSEGGMGAVLLVEGMPAPEGVREGWPGRLALKLLKRSLLHDPEAAARLRRELACHERLSRELQVPRLVPCLGFRDDAEPAAVYGLFPYYPDGTLADLLARDGGSAEAVWILADAAEGLQSLHGHGYVHRDVHPSNIFVEREGRRRRGVLGDLGVGIFLEFNTLVSGEEIERARALRAGHRGYIDPWDVASPAADLFAVGATLYRILAGRDPAEPGRREPLRLPQRLAGPRRAVARELADETLARLTHPDPAERYPSASEARAALVRMAEALESGERAVVRRVAGEPAARRRPLVLPFALLAAALALPAVWAAYRWIEVQPVSEVSAEAAQEPAEASQQSEKPRPSRTLEASASPEPVPIAESGQGPSPENAAAAVPASAQPAASGRTAAAWRAAVDEALRAGERKRALALLAAGLAAHPDDPDLAVRFALASGGESDERARAGRERLARAVARLPLRGDLRLALARLALERGDEEGAWRALAGAPEATSHREEIEALRVTLAAGADRVR